MDSDRRRTSIGSQRILQTDFSLQNGCLIEVPLFSNITFFPYPTPSAYEARLF